MPSRPRRLLRLTGVLALAVAASACASSRRAELERSSAPIQALADTAYVDLEDLAEQLALSVRDLPGRAELELSGIDDRRILVFPGTRTVSVAGTIHELLEPARETDGRVWIARGDAISIRALWRGLDPMTIPLASFDPPPLPDIPAPPDPIPFHAGRESVTAPAPAAVESVASTDATWAERRAWGVPLKRRWQYLVIHHSASPSGSASSFHAAHKKRGWDGLGYHFVIGNGRGAADGAIEVGYRWTGQKTGAHAGNKLMNERGIGICLVGNFEVNRPTARQLEALDRLCRFLARHCGIPNSGLKLHRDVRGTACPGKHFPRGWTFGRSASPVGPRASRR